VISSASYAATYVFGEDGINPDLTGPSGPGSTWPSSNTYIIAGDCYVPDNYTLTLQAGVNVYFDYYYDGDCDLYNPFPTIEVKGTIQCEGTTTNYVTFTNYSGTTGGLYKGIYLNGSSGYEGRLAGSFVKFLYGGQSNGIIRVGTDGELDLGNSIIRHSNKHGIYFENTGGIATLDTCDIDSCEDGISWTEVAGDNGSLITKYCSFVDNDSVAINFPPRDPVRDEIIIAYRDFFQGNGIHIRISRDLANQSFITNSYFLEGDCGIIFHQSGNLDNTYSQIYNNVFVGCDYGIVFTDIDYVPNVVAGDTLRVDIEHNVFWDIENTSLHIGHMTWNDLEWGLDAWPTWTVKLDFNIFGEAGNFDINLTFDGQTIAAPLVTDFNALEIGLNCQGVSTDVALTDRNGVTFSFVDDENDLGFPIQANDYDFHLELIMGGLDNWGANTDPDASPADIGCYGGPFGWYGVGGIEDDANPGGLNPAFDIDEEEYADVWLDCAFYVALPPDNDPQIGIMLPGTYYMFDDFSVSDVGIGTELYIRPGSRIVAKGDYTFGVAGTIVTGEEAGDPNSIRFLHDGINGNGWEGIYIHGKDAAGSILRDIEVEDVDSWPGIEVTSVDEPGTPIIIENVNVHDNYTGVRINDSNVNIDGLTAQVSEYYGLYTLNNSGNIIKVYNLEASNNDGTHAECAGLRNYYSSPFIGVEDSDETESRIMFNGQYGMWCKESSPIMSSNSQAENWGNVDIGGNVNSQIYLKDGSTPWFFEGINNIMPPLDNDVPTEYAVQFGLNQPDDWDASDNYWGTDDPMGYADELFSDLNKIIINAEQLEYIDNRENLRTAFELIGRAEYIDAIGYLKAALENERTGADRFTAMRLLTLCYNQGNGDFSELRRYLNNFAENCEDRSLAFSVETQAILTLHEEDRYQECVAAFESRRNRVACLSDSVRNEQALLIASIALEPRNEIASMGGRKRLATLDAELLQLDELFAAEGNRKTGNTIPNSFELNSVYPNPFNGQTVISFDLDQSGMIDVAIFDLSGRCVATVENRQFDAGRHSLTWNAKSTPAGVYVVKITGPSGVRSSRIALVR